MALSGFQSARIGIFDPNTENIQKDNIFNVDPKEKGSVVSATISNISPTITPIYGSDQEWKAGGKGVGAISVAFIANAIPLAVRQKILGMETFDGGIAGIGKKTQSPYCIFEMISHDAVDESITAHLALVKGTFHLTSVAPKTNTNTTVYDQDQLTFTATTRDSDGFAYFEALEDEKDFDTNKWETMIYGMPLTTIDGGSSSASNVNPTDSTDK
ncbi:phage tail protein [Companilactobacillus jidongensis]|uniref:phage tail protein n=1 Tax=Companilactobacillus jidongensis TaxID=2486006 RepID=UPI000F7751B3|nr:phage tail protein [Companilactobacillus jidongensis]